MSAVYNVESKDSLQWKTRNLLVPVHELNKKYLFQFTHMFIFSYSKITLSDCSENKLKNKTSRVAVKF